MAGPRHPAYALRVDEKPDKPVKITLIEPEPGEVVWILKLLESCSLTAEVADAMASEHPDLDGADIIMIGLEGVGAPETELLTRLKGRFPRVPLIVLAGTDAAAWSGEAVRLGAQHVLDKAGLTSEKLSSTLRYHALYASGKRPAPAGLTGPDNR